MESDSGQQRPAAAKQSPSTPWILFFTLALPAIYAYIIRPLLGSSSSSEVASVIGLLLMWVIAASVMALVRIGEHRTLASIGWRRPTLKTIALGVGIGVVLSLTVPALSLLAALVLPEFSTGEGSVTSAAESSWWLVLFAVITAGVTEEIIFRGYALERLEELTGNRLLSSVVSIGAFTVLHLAGWNLLHVIGVVIPLGVALTALYWWKRDLMIVIIAHTVIDLPLVFIATQQ